MITFVWTLRLDRPLKLLQHGCDAGSSSIIGADHFQFPISNFQFPNDSFSVWVPNVVGVFHERSHQGGIAELIGLPGALMDVTF